MILVWSDVKSFNRHVENMKAFRRLHPADDRCEWKLFKDMPMADEIQPPYQAGGFNRFNNSCDRAILVPMWKIVLPRGLQN